MVDAIADRAVPLGQDRRECLHCGLPVGASPWHGDFCCAGCEAVHELLRDEDLGRFYELRGGRGAPVPERQAARRDTKWLEAIEERVRGVSAPTRVLLDVQGLHCVGCVWLIEELFRRVPGHGRVVVNASLGRVDLVVEGGFDLRAFVASVERFGYLFGPPVKRAPGASRDLLWRMGICAAIAMNSMIFAIPLYAGLDRGAVFRLFTALNLALGALAVAVGGTVFFRSAWHALRQRVLHLDLPIALGIALAFAGSVHSYLAHRSQSAYFDTLDVFITLMLLGRWLQERAVERNRQWLLASDGAAGLLARRVREGRVEVVACSELRQGDELLVTPGDLVPLDARLAGRDASFSLDWIVGESRPRRYAAGDVVPAGAFACGSEARTLRAETGFAASSLGELLRAPDRAPDAARTTPWFQRLAKVYVAGVLAVSAVGFAAWWAATGDLSRALGVTTALLIVTCPCAFGIATPLAYEMVQAGLRRAGLYVRRASFLDRAASIRRVVFDKTGTLTTGALALATPAALEELSPEERGALYDLVARSGHPKSVAIREALDALGGDRPRLDPGACVSEHPGRGLELARGASRWRLGAPGWAAFPRLGTSCGEGDVVLGADGMQLAVLSTEERLRPDAAREVRALADDGMEVWLLSGDAQSRVDAAARASGVPGVRALGDRSPADKARFLDAHTSLDTLFVGDGVNDALALDHAFASGTPAVDRPYVPARADFFFLTPGLAPIRTALRSSRALAHVVRVDLAIALAYNALTIAFALAGKMSPLLCAILMPASSLTTIGATVAALGPRRRLWRS